MAALPDLDASVPTMVPSADLLPDVLPTDRLNARGMAQRELRDELRHINNVGNVGT
ncbi:MAG: hypothetical protein HN783_12370, partial [Ilumatobacter sp.]|nr:hypothetical protein [Ilumatobacter sp.]